MGDNVVHVDFKAESGKSASDGKDAEVFPIDYHKGLMDTTDITTGVVGMILSDAIIKFKKITGLAPQESSLQGDDTSDIIKEMEMLVQPAVDHILEFQEVILEFRQEDPIYGEDIILYIFSLLDGYEAIIVERLTELYDGMNKE